MLSVAILQGIDINEIKKIGISEGKFYIKVQIIFSGLPV
jgi:hypothetical protein